MMLVEFRYSLFLCALLLFAAGASTASAQTFTIRSVQGSRPSFGTVGAASNGTTTYRISPSGSVSVIQGNGGSAPSGTRAGATVTVRCSGSSCSTSQAMLKLARTGSVSGRAQSLSSFFVESSDLAVDWIANQADGSLQVRLAGFSNGGDKTVRVGVDMTILGDNASTSTSATAGWSVNIAKWPNVPGMPGTGGTATASVRRAISATSTAMSFGAISRPASGIGTVIINASTGARTAGPLTPPGLRPGMTYGRGTVTVTGQSGTTINITTPSSFVLSNGASELLAAPTLSANNPITLSGSSMTVGVGGALVVPSNAAVGLYNGTITLTVSYN